MEDRDIVRLFLDRDERALSELTVRYGNYGRRIALSVLGNGELAEEVLNDAALRVWDSIPPAEPERLSVYFGKIVRNLAISRHRMENAGKRGGGQLTAVLDELEEIAGSATPETAVETGELTGAVNDFLAGLPAEKRQIFMRRYWYCDSVKDIAGRFGRTENSVSVILNRLRTALKKHLKERGFDV